MDLLREFDLTQLRELTDHSVRCILHISHWGLQATAEAAGKGGWMERDIQDKYRQHQKLKSHEDGQKIGSFLVDSNIAIWKSGKAEALHFGVNHAYQPQVLWKLMGDPEQEGRVAVHLLPQAIRLTQRISRQHACTMIRCRSPSMSQIVHKTLPVAHH